MDYLRFAAFKAGSTLAWLIVRPLPIPFDKPGSLRWRLMAWLWGWAYVSDFTLDQWRDMRRWKAERL